MTESWLMILDPQHVFADPTSEWYSPDFQRIIEPCRRLHEHFGDHTIITRWLPGANRHGSWVPYFEKWQVVDRDNEDPIFDLVDEAMVWVEHPTVDYSTWGKWSPLIKERYGLHDAEIVLASVATRPLLVTALQAADDGAHVTVISDACVGRHWEVHDEAMDTLAMYSPQISVTTCEEYLAGR